MVVSDQFVLCKAALIFAATRWLLSVALDLFTSSAPSHSSSSSSNLSMLRSCLSLTTFGSINRRLPESQDTSCAVCLNRLRKSSQVWELTNCCHVFHKQCLESWLCYDDKLTCPLCRASLLEAAPQLEPPSWAVERMLYLFGDDLLP